MDDETVSEAWFDVEARLKAYVPQQLYTVQDGLIFKPQVSAEYIESIRSAFKDVRLGDSYEVCLTTNLAVPLSTIRSHLSMYASLPSGALCSVLQTLVFDRFSLTGAFSEIDQDGEIETKPIGEQHLDIVTT